jgi:sugar phosphate isomerase/epimerase
MNTNRRDFLKSTLMGTTALVATVSPLAVFATEPEKEDKPFLKLSFQEGVAPGKNLADKFDFMEKYGIAGFEPRGSDLADCVKEYQQLLRGRNIRISAVCAGFKGFILSENAGVREHYKSKIKDIIAAAGELRSVGVIIVPVCDGQKQGEFHTAGTQNFLIEQMSELAEYAEKHNTTVILEPLNRKEASSFRKVADVARICRAVNRKGLHCMGDFWHMTSEEISDSDAFISGGEYLNHVHIASRKTRCLPGEDGQIDNYLEGFKGLKKIKYQGYVSYECSIMGERDILVPASINLLRDQWKSC